MTEDKVARVRILRALGQACAKMNDYELAALAYTATRFANGAEVYGHFSPHTDTRNLEAERAAEDADGLVYDALAHVMRVVRRPP